MSLWKKALLAAAALAGAGCASGETREYQNNDLQLAVSYAAKEVCSCVFVMEQPEEWCRAWTQARPAVASVRVDRKAKTVDSAALLLWGARARYADPRFGCVLE